MNKRRAMLALSTAIAIGATLLYGNANLSASEFEGNESYWTSTCSVYTSDTNIQTKCNEYRAYLKAKQNDAGNRANAAQAEIDALQGDLVALGNLAYQREQEVNDISAKITEKEGIIKVYDDSMAVAQGHIDEQQIVVDARKDKVKERMLFIQQSINTNEYVNYIMGSEDLMKFVERSENIDKFTSADNKAISLLNEAIVVLDKQKAELQRLKDTQEAEKASLETEKTSLEAKKAEADSALAALEAQKASLTAAQAAANAEANNIGGLMPPVMVPPGDSGSGGNLNWARNFNGPTYRSTFNTFSNVNLTGQCTWYVLGRVAEVNGGWVKDGMPTGHAYEWYGAAGRSKGTTPAANAIMVWGANSIAPYGHVAFVESYENGIITFSEGNYNAGGALGYGSTLEEAIRYTNTASYSYQDLLNNPYRGNFIGFIYY